MSEKMAIAEMILIALMLGAGVNLRRRASILDKCILFAVDSFGMYRSEEHTSELQSQR